MLDFLLMTVYVAQLIFFLGSVFFVTSLAISIIHDIHVRYHSKTIYAISIILGVLIVILYIAVALCLCIQVITNDMLPLWMEMSGVG